MSFVATAVGVAVNVGVNYYQGQQQKKAEGKAREKQKAAEKEAKKQRYLDRRARRKARRESRRNERDIKAPLNLTAMIRNSVEPRRIVYGRCRVGGIWLYAEATGNDNDTLVMVLALSEGPIERVETVYFDADIPTIDDDGLGTGVYTDDLIIRSHLADIYDSGERTFTADAGADTITAASDVEPAFAVGDMVTVRNDGGSLPGGLAAGTPYWIQAIVSGTTYKLSNDLDTYLLTPGAVLNITSSGTGTHYLTKRSSADSGTCHKSLNWKPDEHKLLGIAYLSLFLKASGGQFGAVPDVSAVIHGRNDILDPRQKQTYTAGGVDTGAGTIAFTQHGIKDGNVVVPFGTPNSAGLVTGGLTHGQKYYAFPSGSGNLLSLTDRWGRDKVSLTSLDTGMVTLVPGGYDNNAALCLAHYLSDPLRGVNVDFWEGIDQTQLEAAADTCDETIETLASATAVHTFDPADVSPGAETVTITDHTFAINDAVRLTTTGVLPAGLAAGTDYYVGVIDQDTIEFRAAANARNPVAIADQGTGVHSIFPRDKRYTVDGAIDLSQNPEDILTEFKTAMGNGDIVYLNGKFFIYPGRYEAPTFEITQDFIVGAIEYSNVSSRLERINEVGGVYMAEGNDWQPFDFPVVQNATYKTDDGETLRHDLNLPFTKSPAAAQRLAKIILEESRMTKKLSLVCNLRAFPALAAKTVKLTIPRYNFTEKVFRVELFKYLGDPGGTIECLMDLVEWDSSIYDWDFSTDEVEINAPASIINPGKKVADVASSPAAGSGHSFPLSVTLSTTTSNATIRYTVNGTTPATIASGTEYTGSFNINDGDTVRARGFLAGFQDSDAYSGQFTS